MPPATRLWIKNREMTPERTPADPDTTVNAPRLKSEDETHARRAARPRHSEVNILWFPPDFHDPRDLDERSICARPAAVVSHPNLTAPGVATPMNPTRTRRSP